jgi:hypothetical protein
MTARPERVAAEEVRQRMLDAGRELALAEGAALTIEHLRLEEVIQRARVPRSSVYRMWPYREDYIDDLLCYLAGAGSWFSDRPVQDPETAAIASELVSGNRQLLASMAGRRALLCEVIRVTSTRNYDVLSESAPWRLHMALIATLGSTRSGDARRRIAEALEDSQRRSRESIVAVLSELSQALGLRLRDPAYSLEHVQLAGGLLIQATALRNVQVQVARAEPAGTEQAGAAQSAAEQAGTEQGGTAQADTAQTAAEQAGMERGRVSPPEVAFVNGLLNGPVPGPGMNGEPVEWTLTALAYLGIVDTFLELDPDFVPPAAAAQAQQAEAPRLRRAAGQREHPVAEHRHSRRPLGREVAGLAFPEQAAPVLIPAEVAVAEYPPVDSVDVAGEGRRQPAQRQRRDAVLAQVSPQDVGMLRVRGQGRVGEHGREQAVLGHDDETVDLVVDDADGVEFEEALRHHERGLAGVADGPVPAARRQGGVAAHLVVGVEPALGLQRRQHQLVGPEERHELGPVAAHVSPALGGLLLVAEDQVRFPGGQVDGQPGDLAGTVARVPYLVTRGEPGGVVVGQRQQGRGEEAGLGGNGAEAVHLVVEVVDQVQRADGARRGPADLEHAPHAVAGPVKHQVAVGPGQPALGGEPLSGGEAAGRAETLPQLDSTLDQFWTHGK